MSLLSQAIQLNNHGIFAFVQSDDKVTAIRSFTHALKLLKTALALTVESDEGNSSLPGATSLLLQERDIHTVELPRRFEAYDTETIVFNQFFEVPIVGASDTAHDIDSVHSCTSAVLFNLALSYHCIGSVAGRSKAAKLYDLVIQMLGDISLLTASKLALVVKLGCINNLFQIRYSNGNYQDAWEGLHHISFFLQQIPSSQALLEQEEPEIRQLLMNIVLLKEPSVAAAA